MTKISLSLPEADSLSRETLERVYKNLGSDFVVLGSFLDVGDTEGTIRLDLRVQDAALGETIASMAETGSETSLPDLVTRAGADLRAKLGISAISPVESAAARAAFASEPAVTRLFAQGVAKLEVYDALGARDLLEKAVVADPSFAVAHSALAEAWSSLGYQTKATGEARKALDLAANLARERHLWIEGRYYETSEEWDKAVDIFHTLFNFFPDNLDYGLHLAKAEIEANWTRANGRLMLCARPPWVVTIRALILRTPMLRRIVPITSSNCKSLFRPRKKQRRWVRVSRCPGFVHSSTRKRLDG